MDVLEYTAGQLNANRADTSTYTPDMVGAVQLLEDSGFAPFSQNSPLDSSLTQIFDRFIQKTGLATDAGALKDDFLAANSNIQRSLGVYDALENTFSSRGSGDKAAIVDFLNTKIDDYFAERDQNSDTTLTLEESGFSETLFEEADADGDAQLSSQETRDNFYEGYRQLNNVLDYFRNSTGNLVDTYV